MNVLTLRPNPSLQGVTGKQSLPLPPALLAPVALEFKR